MATRRGIAAWSFVFLLIACVGRLPRPAYVEQPTAALAVVGYPPPPARVEFVPARPVGGAVWIDGEWAWQGRRWAWRIGRWVVPPNHARFAPWTLARGADGTLYYAAGTWRDDRHQEIAEPAPLATAKPNISDVVDPSGELERTGKSIHPSGEPHADGGAVLDAGFEDGPIAEAEAR